MGSRALWKAFGQIIARRFGERAAFAATINAGDPISPVAELLTLGLAALTIYQIYRAWDDIWGEVEQELGNPNSEIVVTEEPQNQVYTTPNGEQQTIEHTGSAPPQVETGTPPFDTEAGRETIELQRNTGGQTQQQPNARDYIMTAETGLSDRAQRAIEKLENIKYDPLGDINSRTNHNHYDAARREARGEVVARKQNGEPFSHISDLQQAYNGLQNVREALEAELERMDNLPDDASEFEDVVERGFNNARKRYREVQRLTNRLRNFLNEIGHAPPYPPFHTWPPGT